MNRGFLRLLVLTAVLSVAPAVVAQEMTLDYEVRYRCQGSEPDHLLDAVGLTVDRVVVAGNRGLALLDRAALTPGGTQQYLHRLTGLNARNVYPVGITHLLVNLARQAPDDSAGFAVVRVVGDQLQMVTTRHEPGVLFEKMHVTGDLLYVAAHGRGIRVFSIADPEDPVQVGSLEDGFTDAWAAASEGDRLWVADGGGGLKQVDVSDPTLPTLLWGEDEQSSVGTAEDVSVRGGRVWVAAGGAGLLVYDADDLNTRLVVPVGGTAKDLAWVDSHLAVATMAATVVVEPGDPPVVVAEEIAARRGASAALRICSAVGALGADQVLAANWNWVDVYRLGDAAASTTPDISSDVQRIRFAPDGGERIAEVWNDGGGTLEITGVSSSSAVFTTDLVPTSLVPGERVSFTVACDGSPVGASGVLALYSNDPDENPLPIQVFGDTEYLDPGEIAVDFQLPSLSRDPTTGELVEGVFHLSEHLGKVVWFQIYGTW